VSCPHTENTQTRKTVYRCYFYYVDTLQTSLLLTPIIYINYGSVAFLFQCLPLSSGKRVQNGISVHVSFPSAISWIRRGRTTIHKVPIQHNMVWWVCGPFDEKEDKPYSWPPALIQLFFYEIYSSSPFPWVYKSEHKQSSLKSWLVTTVCLPRAKFHTLTVMELTLWKQWESF
jgi:hypothetical protein